MPYGFFYGLELAAVVTITLLGILVNSLLGKNRMACGVKILIER